MFRVNFKRQFREWYNDSILQIEQKNKKKKIIIKIKKYSPIQQIKKKYDPNITKRIQKVQYKEKLSQYLMLDALNKYSDWIIKQIEIQQKLSVLLMNLNHKLLEFTQILIHNKATDLQKYLVIYKEKQKKIAKIMNEAPIMILEFDNIPHGIVL